MIDKKEQYIEDIKSYAMTDALITLKLTKELKLNLKWYQKIINWIMVSIFNRHIYDTKVA